MKDRVCRVLFVAEAGIEKVQKDRDTGRTCSMVLKAWVLVLWNIYRPGLFFKVYNIAREFSLVVIYTLCFANYGLRRLQFFRILCIGDTSVCLGLVDIQPSLKHDP